MGSYMGALAQMMADSRFGDVLIESGASANESINQVTNGSHYNSDMRVYKLMADALEWLMLLQFTIQSLVQCGKMPDVRL